MNTKSLLKIVDAIATEKNLTRSKVIDSILYTGTVKFGNLNDRINMANRVCPNYTTEQVDAIFNDLQDALFAAGYAVPDDLQLSYMLTDTPPKEAIFVTPVRSLQLAFVLD